jgi:hypothetical protein
VIIISLCPWKMPRIFTWYFELVFWDWSHTECLLFVFASFINDICELYPCWVYSGFGIISETIYSSTVNILSYLFSYHQAFGYVTFFATKNSSFLHILAAFPSVGVCERLWEQNGRQFTKYGWGSWLLISVPPEPQRSPNYQTS